MSVITNTQFIEMLARTERNKVRELGQIVPDSGREEKLHEKILNECRSRGWIALYGSTAHKTHRTLGEPDLIILRDGAQLLMVECKSKTGKLTREQIGFAAWASHLGFTVFTIRSFSEFLKLLHTNHSQ